MEDVGEIKLDLKISLSLEDTENIKEIIEGKNGKIFEERTKINFGKWGIIGVIGTVIFQLGIYGGIKIQNLNLNKKIEKVNKIVDEKKNIIDSKHMILSELSIGEKKKIFEKNDLVSEIEGIKENIGKDVQLNRISYFDNILKIEGYTEKLENLKYLENFLVEKYFKEKVKVDYLKKYGSGFLFLIDVEIF